MNGVDGIAFNYLNEVIFQENTNLEAPKKIQRGIIQIARNRGKLRTQESRYSKTVRDNLISNDASIIGTHKSDSKYSDSINKLQDKKLEMVPKTKFSEDSFKAAYWEIISDHFPPNKNTLSIASDDADNKILYRNTPVNLRSIANKRNMCRSQEKSQQIQPLQTEKTPHIKISKIKNEDLLPITELESEMSVISEVTEQEQSEEDDLDELIPLKINPIEEESKRGTGSRIKGDYIEIYRRLWKENVFSEQVDKTIKI
jgi:hypothetical protein